MVGICRQDTERKLASQAKTEMPVAPVQNLDRTMRYKLGSDRARLKKIASMQRKAEVKAEIVPEYLPYLQGMMESGAGDELLTQVMVWSLDAGLLENFSRLARYALDNGVAMPTEFSRPLAAWLCESCAKTYLQVVEGKTNLDETNLAALRELTLWVERETTQIDMHDEIRAKLHRACGEIVESESPALALEHYETALGFDSHIRVKTKIKALKERLEQLNVSQSPQGQAADGAGSDVVKTPLAALPDPVPPAIDGNNNGQ